MTLIQSFNLDRLELRKITHTMHAMKNLSALLSLFQQFLGPFGFVAVGDNNNLPEVHPSRAHVSVRKRDEARSPKLTSAQVPTRRDYKINSSRKNYWREVRDDRRQTENQSDKNWFKWPAEVDSRRSGHVAATENVSWKNYIVKWPVRSARSTSALFLAETAKGPW